MVVAYNYTGQSTPYITGFWLADQTDKIYIYGEDVAKSVQPGNKVTVLGTKAYYIPQNDAGSAAAINYKGMVQLTSPSLLVMIIKPTMRFLMRLFQISALLILIPYR